MGTLKIDRIIGIFLVSFVSIAPALADDSELRAGVARIDITPLAGLPLGGYAHRNGGAAGTHDPPYATALVLESGAAAHGLDRRADRSLALVTCRLRPFVSTQVGEEPC